MHASRLATRYIHKRGGDLFVWFGEMGNSGSAFEHASTRRPRGREFEAHESFGGIRVWMESRDGVAPNEVHLRRRPWPLGPIEVTWVGGPGGELAAVNIVDSGG